MSSWRRIRTVITDLTIFRNPYCPKATEIYAGVQYLKKREILLGSTAPFRRDQVLTWLFIYRQHFPFLQPNESNRAFWPWDMMVTADDITGLSIEDQSPHMINRNLENIQKIYPHDLQVSNPDLVMFISDNESKLRSASNVGCWTVNISDPVSYRGSLNEAVDRIDQKLELGFIPPRVIRNYE